MLLDLTFNPPRTAAPPTDTEVAQSLRETAASLRRTAARSPSDAANDALHLATILDNLAEPSASRLRARATETLIAPFKILLDRFRAVLHPEPITLETLPADVISDWVTKDGRARIEVFPAGDSNDNDTLQRFANAVQTIAPRATGAPIAMREAARVVVDAFIQAGAFSFLVVVGLLAIALRRAWDVMMALAPILLSWLLTLVSCILIGRPLNFANIIALPLLFGVGVAFSIYFVVAWRAGATALLGSSLSRAVVCSALTTAASFAGLCFSSHPGTASLGELLMISLAWTLVTVLLFEPALLGPPPNTMNPSTVRQ
jgi:predicted exporter